ncbi:hypothetical protein DM02DRAFT_51502 [Periconia macrospinosa]|uniref:Uncharacterized protein n=1 Tax=Periconia macrospinosa TaxID=97972 RepID=A0A2V1DJA7_9PLEO|nr:hypothetical protein DM02DRAFT_51502 [Periconia macrospinosa]
MLSTIAAAAILPTCIPALSSAPASSSPSSTFLSSHSSSIPVRASSSTSLQLLSHRFLPGRRLPFIPHIHRRTSRHDQYRSSSFEEQIPLDFSIVRLPLKSFVCLASELITPVVFHSAQLIARIYKRWVPIQPQGYLHGRSDRLLEAQSSTS